MSNYILDLKSNFPINIPNIGLFYKAPTKLSVCLPQNDNYIVDRQLALETKQYIYNFEHNVRVKGYDGIVKGLPPCFKFMAPTNELPKCELLSNPLFIGHGISLLFSDLQSKVNSLIGGSRQVDKKENQFIKSIEEYSELIILPNTPKLIENQSGNDLNNFNWLNDKEFGRQRLQGLNSGQLIKLTKERIELLGIEEKMEFSKNKSIFNQILINETSIGFDETLVNGSIYMVDYSIFDNENYFEAAKKRGRYVSSPLALFYVNCNDGKIYPLAIKILQNNSTSPVFTPMSHPIESWIFAKLWFQSADGQHMEFITHLYECHLLGEVFTIATHRQLSSSHPIYQLLHPHFNLLLDINNRARNNLLAESGPIESLLGGGSIAALQLISNYHSTYQWKDNTFISRLKKNNTYNDDQHIRNNFKETNGNGSGADIDQKEELLLNYFFKTDGLEIYNCLFEFIGNILGKFYKCDQDVINDFELHSWIQEISNGGTIKGLINGDKIEKIVEITQLVSDIVFRITVEHSIGNHGQWDMFGFVPNVPGALYMDPTKIIEGIPTTFEMILNSLPPKKETQDQIEITHLLANTDTGLPTLITTCYNFQNEKPYKQIVKKFKSQLKSLSETIESRNKIVNMPFSYMDPSKICGSIYI